MNFVLRRDTTSTSFDASTSESDEINNVTWLSGIVESTEESSSGSFYEDYTWSRSRKSATVAHQKEILDRAYKFINDGSLSSEITTDSDTELQQFFGRMSNSGHIPGERHKEGEKLWARYSYPRRYSEKVATGDGNGGRFIESRPEEGTKRPWNEYFETNQQRQIQNFWKPRSSPRISTRKFEDFGQCRWNNSPLCHRPSTTKQRSFSAFSKHPRQLDKRLQKLPESDYGLIEKRALNLEESLKKFRELHRKYQKDPVTSTRNLEIAEKRRILEGSKLLEKKIPMIDPDFEILTAASRRKRKFLPSMEHRFREEQEIRAKANQFSKIPNRIPVLRSSVRISKVRSICSEQFFSEQTFRQDYNRTLFFKIMRENEKSECDGFKENGNPKKSSSNSKIPDTAVLDSRATEAKLLEDIKKRIDRDFERCLEEIESLIEPSKVDSEKTLKSEEIVSNFESSLESNSQDSFSEKTVTSQIKSPDLIEKKSSRPDDHLESIDSGISTDFSRNESDRSKVSKPSNDYLTTGRSANLFSDSDTAEMLDKEVEKAVERFEEELIKCERRAVERGLIDLGRRIPRRKKTKSFQQKRYKHSTIPSAFRNRSTFSSSREFSGRSDSSGGETEYLENISPPSLCSISDSEFENSFDRRSKM